VNGRITPALNEELSPKTHGNYSEQGLLRHAWREEDGDGGGDSQGVQESCAAVSSGRESGDKRAEEKFKEISEANDVLSDEKKRKVYDQVGFYSDQIDPATAEAYARQQGGGRRSPVDFDGFDFSGFQSGPGVHPGQQAGAGSHRGAASRTFFSGIFTGAQQPQRARGPQPGSDLEYQATVDFWTAIRGGQARIQVNRQETCPTCHGQAHTGGPMQCRSATGRARWTQMGGRMKFNISCPRCNGTGRISNDCATCNGEGVVSRTESVEFRMKPGTRDGQRIRLQGKGNAGLNGGPAGTCS